MIFIDKNKQDKQEMVIPLQFESNNGCMRVQTITPSGKIQNLLSFNREGEICLFAIDLKFAKDAGFQLDEENHIKTY